MCKYDDRLQQLYSEQHNSCCRRGFWSGLWGGLFDKERAVINHEIESLKKEARALGITEEEINAA